MIPSQWIESVARVPLFYTLCFGLLLLIVEIHPVLMVSALWSQVLLIICLKQGDSFGFGSLFAAMFNIISDGGCLCVLSIYVILLSHILVVSNPDTFLEIRKTYRGILSLPKAAPLTLSGLSLYDRASDMASALATDFCSTARLMIAWAEDLPQGFIGLFAGFITNAGKWKSWVGGALCPNQFRERYWDTHRTRHAVGQQREKSGGRVEADGPVSVCG